MPLGRTLSTRGFSGPAGAPQFKKPSAAPWLCSRKTPGSSSHRNSSRYPVIAFDHKNMFICMTPLARLRMQSEAAESERCADFNAAVDGLCLASVTFVISVSFLPYSIPVFGWCNNIIHTSLLKYRAFQQNPDKSFLVVVALDLLSKLTNCLGMELQPPINTSSPDLLAPLTGAVRRIMRRGVWGVALRYTQDDPEFKHRPYCSTAWSTARMTCLWLEGDAEDAAVPDKDTDIKSHHYGSNKSHGLERNANGNTVAQLPKSRKTLHLLQNSDGQPSVLMRPKDNNLRGKLELSGILPLLWCPSGRGQI
ncbi:hypothetical protein B0H13DRAFT_2280860 [Mycena leptocephala]|nr:hypothetical protein B0H13DRAFT_2280860 [Mycena leptocephala]